MLLLLSIKMSGHSDFHQQISSRWPINDPDPQRTT